MFNVTVIVPKGQGTGFVLTGVEAREVANVADAQKMLSLEMDDESNGIILIDEAFTQEMPAKLRKRVDESVIPLVMDIPVINKWESMKKSEGIISDIIHRAVGYRIKFSGD
ncbi:V-type ATP synthase subunit F [Candidatus Latescibacterota bacterium]